MYCDLHVHSSASCDSDTEIWDVCERAIGVGLEAVAFTEHVELAPGDYCYKRYDYERSKSACDKAKERYRGRIEVLFGAEVTYHSWIEGEIRCFLAEHGFDLIIGSVHDTPPISLWDPVSAELVKSSPDTARLALRNYLDEVRRLALDRAVRHSGPFW
ncbi:MAG: PHP domain-containing protein, partial [Bacillota bacterium]